MEIDFNRQKKSEEKDSVLFLDEAASSPPLSRSLSARYNRRNIGARSLFSILETRRRGGFDCP